MKNLFVAFFIITSSLLSAQETIAEFDLKLKGIYSKRNVFSIVKDGGITIFFDNKKEMKCYVLNKDKTLSSELIFKRPKTKFKEIIGYNTDDTNYNIYFTDKKKTGFSVLTVDFETKTSSVKNIDLKLNGIFLDAFNKKGAFYILSLDDNSTFNLYRFNSNTSFEITKYSLGGKLKLNKKLLAFSNFKYIGNLEKIDANTPNSIEQTSKYNKIYTTDNEIIITLDKDDKFTDIIRLSIKSESFKVDTINHVEVLDEKYQGKSSNSFYYKENLYQISCTKTNLAFSHININTNERSKIIKLNINDSIWFKNSSIIQKKSGAVSSERKLDKTKQFLRKITAAQPGISIVTINNANQITIGGVLETQAGGAGFYMGGALGGAMSVAMISLTNVYMSPVYHSYGAYTTTKSTYINCLFNNDLKHLKGAIQKNAFDKIKDYEDKAIETLKLKTIFKFGDNYIFGSYWDKKYKLRKFNH